MGGADTKVRCSLTLYLRQAMLLTLDPSFLEVSVGFDFVMSSLLALSATHLAWLTNSAETKNLALYHRGVAFSGLQTATGNFSRENSDAILAASILLSWQEPDW